MPTAALLQADLSDVYSPSVGEWIAVLCFIAGVILFFYMHWTGISADDAIAKLQGLLPKAGAAGAAAAAPKAAAPAEPVKVAPVAAEPVKVAAAPAGDL